jgi:hypothetical protein
LNESKPILNIKVKVIKIYIVEKAIVVVTLDVAALLGSKVKIFEEKSKFAKEINLIHSPAKS